MQTVISVFDDDEIAQWAVQRLMEEGFDRNDIHVQQRDLAVGGAAKTHRAYTSDQEQRGILASIGYFFASLFNQDHPSGHAGTYAEAVRRGGSVVILDTHNDEQAERAVSLLHEMGAVDVDARVDEWRAEGWKGYQLDHDAEKQRNPQQDQQAPPEGQPGSEGERGPVRVIQRQAQPPVRELVRRTQERAMDR